MACLIISAGKNAGACYKLDKLPMSAGREVARDIQIMDPKVSRRHFLLKKSDDQQSFLILVQDAKNGVYVNGKKVDEATLKDGDRVVVGETELTFLINDDPARINEFNRMRQFSPAARAPTIT
jgi:pSer/pThr/pTyr-binding forkhead associated (FHA) protein